jgi:ferredoxin
LPTFHITLLPDGQAFTADAGQTLVRAAALAGIRLPTSCRNGTCRTCMCAAQGKVDYGALRPGLSSEEIEDGWILPCVAHAATDLILDAPGAEPLVVAAPRPFATGPRR